MAKYTKPNYSEQWASAGNIVAPNSVKIQAGHIVEKPNYEYMNWIQNRQDMGIAYALQLGITEWDNATQYQYTLNSHASFVQRNGVVYKAIQTGVNKDPLTESAYWTIAFDDKGSAATVQSNLTTHITNYGTLTGLTNTATARTNLDVYSKAEAAQKNGDATKLFSVANGTTGNEAVNKSQLDTKAPTAGNALQEFAVATATTGNSAVNLTQLEGKTGQATETVAGVSEICTNAELVAGVSDTVVATPSKLRFGFAISLASNGYISFPTWLGGLIIQWGKEATTTDHSTTRDVSFTYPIEFPNSVLMATPSVIGTTVSTSILGAYAGIFNLGNSGLTIRIDETTNATQDCRVGYIAIGH